MARPGINPQIKDRLLASLLKGYPVKRCALDCGVSDITVGNYLRRWRTEGKISPDLKCSCGKPHSHKGQCQRKLILQPRTDRTAVENDWHRQIVEMRPRLLSLGIKLLRDLTKAEDLVSITVEKALKSQHLFQPGTNFKSWIYTILRNNIRTSFRRVKTILPLDSVVLSLEESTTKIALANEIIVQIAKHMPESREICFAIWLDGITYEDAAKRYSIPVGLVKSRLWRAKAKLRDILGETVAE